ncbi:FAD-dependent oxidoreductase [Wenxinia marina]|uniref:2-polyprenyl-6-methoxyphenol hydroxylase n=1 Tax=Wenxinia marina DSM 24838 TaxID=1123501 RepID=A0A0D0NH39_9RHOB|nr:FAD-dependent monooxygenase [Wenxinia marina]KIQ67640.1 2-polyprenyl-6-methoxyphenol hydroxylase [Wenxinia marina DSM 24838]GGL80058.1 pentachlorophenol monooxygenase [Wenxinia marina]
MRILVVGAGPTGLTAAVELARRGLVPRIVEKRATPSPFSRAVGIQSRTLDLLAPSGAAKAIAEEAIPFEGAILHDGRREIGRLPLGHSEDSRLWGLAQDRTEAHLAAALRREGGAVEYGTTFEGLEQDGDVVRATVASETAEYDWVIGADGVHSAVRGALGLPFEGYDLPETWSIADVDAPGWPDPRWFHGFFKPGGEVAVVVPLERARFRVIASDPDALAALPVPMAVSAIRSTGTFRISVRQAPSFRVGRVCLAGDAAHCHSPVGGRGMNLGIADAADLAARISSGEVDGYEAARHPEAARVIRLTERVRRAVQSKEPWRQRLILRTLGLALQVPAVRRAAARRAAGA